MSFGGKIMKMRKKMCDGKKDNEKTRQGNFNKTPNGANIGKKDS
jgi:hypothetical protein